MPGCSINSAILLLEILCVTRSSPCICHQPMCGGIGICKPTKDVVIWGRCVILGFPHGSHHVIGVCHHKLPSLQIATQHKRNFFHPRYYCPRLHCHLRGKETAALIQAVILDNLLSKVDQKQETCCEFLSLEWAVSTRDVAKEKGFLKLWCMPAMPWKSLI